MVSGVSTLEATKERKPTWGGKTEVKRIHLLTQKYRILSSRSLVVDFP